MVGMIEPLNGHYVMILHPVQAAVIEAIDKYGDRDWRRLKREVRKAEQRAKETHGRR